MTNTIGKMELVDVIEHENGDATYSFDLDEDAERVTKEFGLKLILYCGFTGLSTDDAFQAILDRAAYLNQDPDPDDRFDEYGAYGENNPPVGKREDYND